MPEAARALAPASSHASSRARVLLDDVLGGRVVDALEGRHGSVGAAKPVRAFGGAPERPRGGLGVREGGDSPRPSTKRLGDAGRRHDDGEHRLPTRSRPTRLDLLRDLLRRRGHRRHEEHDDRVDLRILEHCRERFAVGGGRCAPEHVDGFARLASGERSAASRPRRALAGSGSSRPAASQASAQRIPRPPAFVSTPTRRPRGSGWLERRAATSISSSSDAARMTPAWWNRASTAASDPASAAVCELAAR